MKLHPTTLDTPSPIFGSSADIVSLQILPLSNLLGCKKKKIHDIKTDSSGTLL